MLHNLLSAVYLASANIAPLLEEATRSLVFSRALSGQDLGWCECDLYRVCYARPCNRCLLPNRETAACAAFAGTSSKPLTSSRHAHAAQHWMSD